MAKSYEDYQKEIAELQKQAEEVRREELSGAIAQIKSLMSKYNLTLQDLKLKNSRTSNKQGTAVAAKYRDPVSGDTWTGRGRSPAWVTKAKADNKLESMLITATAKPVKVASKPAPSKTVEVKPKSQAPAKPVAQKAATKTVAPKKAPSKKATPKPAEPSTAVSTPPESSSA